MSRYGPSPSRSSAPRRRRLGLALGTLFLVGCGSESGAPRLELPPRPPDALTGEGLAAELAPLDLATREARVVEELMSGNVPTWLRELRPIRSTRRLEGRSHDVVFWVTPDYLALGSDEDYLLFPLSPHTAQRVADTLSAALPTPRMVDDIWLGADRRLAPQRLSPRDSVQSVRTVDYFSRHTSVIGGQRRMRGVEPGALVAGHKKDIVVASVLSENPGKVAVYGMHRPDGVPTQPLTTAAEADWVYYNHGVRLVHDRVRVDGADMALHAVLRDSVLAPLLSGSGPLLEPRYLPPFDSAGTPPGD